MKLNKIIVFALIGLCESSYIFAIKPVQEALGFDPHISPIPLASENKKAPVIGVLGFPDHPLMYKGKFDTKETFTVTFAFHNNFLVTPAALNPIFLARAIKSIDLGQESDACSLIYVMLKCVQAGHKKIHIFANSRGCAATLMALYMISHYENFNNYWQKLGCSSYDIACVRECLSEGEIFLAHPLLHHEDAFQKASTIPLSLLKRVPGIFAFKTFFYWGLRLFLYSCTRFDYQRAQLLSPYQCLCAIASLDLYHITIVTAYREELVSDTHIVDVISLAKSHKSHINWRQGGCHHWDIKALLRDFRDMLVVGDCVQK